jgi:hypothetical protein
MASQDDLSERDAVTTSKCADHPLQRRWLNNHVVGVVGAKKFTVELQNVLTQAAQHPGVIR